MPRSTFPIPFISLGKYLELETEKMKKGKAKGNTELQERKSSLNKDLFWSMQAAMIIYNRERQLSLIMISCILRIVVSLLCAREDCHPAVQNSNETN